MRAIYREKKISSILSVIPQKEFFFEDEIGNYDFPVKQSMRLKRLMGFNKHRISKESSTVSDFTVYGLKYILDNKWVDKDEIGALIVVTLCPDFFVPHISNIVQGKIDLPKDVLCLDIAQGCCGFLVGLSQAFMLLEHMEDKKVILVNGDVLSHKISIQDRNEYPLIGDGIAITIIENSSNAGPIRFEINMDGARGGSLIIPAGGFRMPANEQTSIVHKDEEGNSRALNHMHMDGSAVFNFVQTEVPQLIWSMLKDSDFDISDIDYFFFHQPNRFILKKLSEKLGIDEDKMPMNLVENFGNTSGASIPMTVALNCAEEMCINNYKCMLSAFGSGLAWGAMILDVGMLTHCETIVSEL